MVVLLYLAGGQFFHKAALNRPDADDLGLPLFEYASHQNAAQVARVGSHVLAFNHPFE